MAGNANHAAIGTDLDGGYGTEQTPRDLDTIAALKTYLTDRSPPADTANPTSKKSCTATGYACSRKAWA